MRVKGESHCRRYTAGRGRDLGEPDAYSVISIEAPGEDVAALRAEIEAVVALANEVVDRDPLNEMVPIDPGLVIVLVD